MLSTRAFPNMACGFPHRECDPRDQGRKAALSFISLGSHTPSFLLSCISHKDQPEFNVEHAYQEMKITRNDLGG